MLGHYNVQFVTGHDKHTVCTGTPLWLGHMLGTFGLSVQRVVWQDWPWDTPHGRQQARIQTHALGHELEIPRAAADPPADRKSAGS